MAADGKHLLRFLLLQSLVLGALWCSCADAMLQRQFCDHEYVMKVFVKGFRYMPERMRYREELLELFKGYRSKLDIERDVNVFVVMPNACILDLMNDETYVIFGSNVEGKVFTDLCSGNAIWNQTSETFRNNVNTETYKNGCNCKNRPDSYGSCLWFY